MVGLGKILALCFCLFTMGCSQYNDEVTDMSELSMVTEESSNFPCNISQSNVLVSTLINLNNISWHFAGQNNYTYYWLSDNKVDPDSFSIKFGTLFLNSYLEQEAEIFLSANEPGQEKVTLSKSTRILMDTRNETARFKFCEVSGTFTILNSEYPLSISGVFEF